MRLDLCLIFTSLLFTSSLAIPTNGDAILDVKRADTVPVSADITIKESGPTGGLTLTLKDPTIKIPPPASKTPTGGLTLTLKDPTIKFPPPASKTPPPAPDTSGPTTTPTPTAPPPPPPPASSTTSSAPPATTTTSGLVPIVVVAGTTVVGGAGGGFFVVNGGAPIAVAAGVAVVAEAPKQDPPKSEPPTSTEASSSTSSAPPQPTVECMVFPGVSATAPELLAFKALFDVEFPKGGYVANEVAGFGLQYITAFLTADQIKKFEGNKLVAGVVPDFKVDELKGEKPVSDPNFTAKRRRRGSSHEKDLDTRWANPEPLEERNNIQRRAIVNQAKAPDEMKVFSQPPGTVLKNVNGYSYDDSAGVDITVYVVDTGYYTRSPSYTGMKTKPRWIFPRGAEDTAENDFDSEGHGTCAGSKVNSPNFGIAKNANLVIVKSSYSANEMNQAFIAILNDVEENNLQGKAIISFSRKISADIPPDVVDYLDKVMGMLTRQDVVFVTTTGNDGDNVDVNSYPQNLVDKYPIINVGASDNLGKNASFSQGGPRVTVMAPGIAIHCAGNSFFSSTVDLDGTSFAAPAVAGLAAYLLALGEYPQLYQRGKVAQNMRDLLQELSYPRLVGGFPIVYNGQGATCTRAGQKVGKRFGGDCDPIATPTPTAAPPPPPPPPSSTQPPPPPPTSTPPPAPTAPPAPKPLVPIYSLKDQAPSGQGRCMQVKPESIPKAGTYGFQFITGSDVLLQIGEGTSPDPTFYQGMGSGNGTLYIDVPRALSICTVVKSDVTSDLTWNVFSADRIFDLGMPPSGAKEVVNQSQNADAGTLTCFPTTPYGLEAGKMYTFHYTMGPDTTLRIADDSSSGSPAYYVAKGSENPGNYGTLFMTSGNAINFCFENKGTAVDPVKFSLQL